jgi:hypothetical protein
MIGECVERGANMVCLPENFAYQVNNNQGGKANWHENPKTGIWFQRYR